MKSPERHKLSKESEQESSAPPERESAGDDASNARSESNCQPDCAHVLDEEARRALAKVYDLLLNLRRDQATDKEQVEADEV